MGSFKPQLCEIKAEPFNDPRWIWERKLDGIRAIITVKGATWTIAARSGTDKSHLFPELDIQVKADCVLDGEIVALTGKFNDIQHRANRINGIGEAAKQYPAMFMVFDCVEMALQAQDGCKGNLSLLETRLEHRKQLLARLVVPTSTCQVVETHQDGVSLYNQAIALGWEGVIGKDLDGIYRQGSRDWYKVKVPQFGEFLVVGCTEGTGWRKSTFGALILARVEGGTEGSEMATMVTGFRYRYVGQVGTGFNDQEIAVLNGMVRNTPTPCPFKEIPAGLLNPVWCAPFPVKVKFLEITNDGLLRFPAYKGRV